MVAIAYCQSSLGADASAFIIAQLIVTHYFLSRYQHFTDALDVGKQGSDDSLHGHTTNKSMPAALLAQLQTCQGTFFHFELQIDAKTAAMISVFIIVSWHE